ncbi:phytanoyl-CoA dioxygenase family protein [Kitasatospora sp. NPDC058478]|uniref:phytanoyl-CoA dioxygenase family protein n=1 Tax=unclassified Kitasatospora TaxID=2633591 RepID=UPI0036539E87
MLTTTPSTLTEQQARHFRDLGYLRLPYAGLPDGLLGEVAELVRACAAHLPTGQAKVYRLYQHDQGSLNAPDAQEPRLHRDILQPTRGLLTAVVYFEDATVETGCTWIVPGSHRAPYVGVPQPDGGGTWMDEHPELSGLADQAVPVPVPAGGVLLFDGTVFHTVGANSDGSTRTSVVLGYRAADELDALPDPDRQVIVAGAHLYRGNDRPS